MENDNLVHFGADGYDFTIDPKAVDNYNILEALSSPKSPFDLLDAFHALFGDSWSSIKEYIKSKGAEPTLTNVLDMIVPLLPKE
jgi:hypothetical protein